MVRKILCWDCKGVVKVSILRRAYVGRGDGGKLVYSVGERVR